MLATVAVTVATDNLAAGVAVGVMLSGVFFTFKVARLLQVQAEVGEGDARVYRVTGQVFFASADMLVDAFDVREIDGAPVRIDVTQAHFWDVTAVTALTKVVERLRKHGSVVEVVGLNQASRDLILKLDAAPE
ncbi:sulfate permease [compost metagenome]